MAQSKRSIHLSVGKIRKEVPGNHLVTAGSACVLEWPWKLDQASLFKGEDKIFFACTSQVVSKTELNSSNVCTADFLPLKWGGKETFRVNDLPLQDVQLSGKNKDISLILIPVDPLHKQKRFSRLRKNKFLCDRPQPCERGSESELLAAKSKPDKLFCYVIRESPREDTFDLQCYLLEVDENGSYYLQVHGNKAELKSLKDFDRYEYPIGSVILNDKSKIVGFLAFGEKEEIVPMFILPHNQQDCTSGGDEHIKPAPLTVDLNKDSDSTEDTEECKNGDGLESSYTNATTPAEKQEDVNKNKEEDLSSDNNLNTIQAKNKVFNNSFSVTSNSHEDEEMPSKVTDKQSFEPPPLDEDKDMLTDTENSSDTLHTLENLTISESSQRSQPLEMSFSSLNRHGLEIHTTGADQEEEDFCSLSPCILSVAQRSSVEGYYYSDKADKRVNGSQAKRPPIQRSQSDHNVESLSEAKMTLLKGYSVPYGPSYLESDALVESVILRNVYIMDTLKRGLDTSYNKNVENWKHLAHRQGVPQDVIMKLMCQSPASRSEALFQLLETRNPNLTIGILKCHLQDLKMENVVTCINHLQDHMKIDETLEKRMIPGKFFILLDEKQEEHWEKLGGKLGIDHQDLTGIKIDCAARHENPAQEVIEIICAEKPNMSISEFKTHLGESTGIHRNDVIKKLDKQPGLKTLEDLKNNLDLMREVTCMLNATDNSQMKTFLDLASKCGIPSEVYLSLQPPCSESPIEQVLKDIVGRKPGYTVHELFNDLRAMHRSDVETAVRCHFVG